MRLAFSTFVVMIAALLGLGLNSASAQAPAPIGFWTTDSGETLLITAAGECSQGLNGSITAAGSCTWQSTSRGGILTIFTNGPVYYNVVWIDDNTISVWGDIFHRRQ